MRLEIEVDDLIRIIQGARRKDIHGVEEIVRNRILPEARRGGDPAIARALADTLTNEKRKLFLFGVNLTKLEEAWMRSEWGQAETFITGNSGEKYIAHRDDWSLHMEHQSAVTYLESLPQPALMRLARLDWKPRGPELSALDLLARETDRDEG